MSAGERVKEYATAGGIVLDAAGRVLLIERTVVRDGVSRHEVRLPKGKIDPGETPEEAACREVGEETGYRAVAITHDLGWWDNRYEFKGEQWLRHERYFLMRLLDDGYGGNQSPHPGSEEALFLPRWETDLHAAEAALTYGSEQEWIGRARRVLEED